MQADILRLLRKNNGKLRVSFLSFKLDRSVEDIEAAIERMPKLVTLENGYAELVSR